MTIPEKATADRPFAETLVAEGTNFRGPAEGHAVADFGDWQAEYIALRQAAGVVPWDAWTEVVLTGAERAEFLNRLATNRLDRLAPGEGAETFLTDARGRVLAYLLVWAEAEQLVLGSPGQFGPRVLAHLDYYLIQEKVELNDRGDELTALWLHGPQAAEVLQRLGALPPPGEHLPHVSVPLGDERVAVRSVRFGAEPSYLLVTPHAAAVAVWTALRQAGVRACGQHAAEVVRIEAGWPYYGVDITEANFPQEVARDRFTLSFTKGCYLGQETVARIDSRGHVNQTLVGLHVPGHVPPALGSVLLAEGQPVGRITSAAWSPGTGAVVALAYVRRGHNTPGSQVSSPVGPAEVIALPQA